MVGSDDASKGEDTEQQKNEGIARVVRAVAREELQVLPSRVGTTQRNSSVARQASVFSARKKSSVRIIAQPGEKNLASSTG